MFKKIIAIICAVLSFFGIPVGEQELSNPDANAEAVELYSYICDVYGEYIISGQQESTWVDGEQYEFEYIYENTGKLPAIRGLDYMNDDLTVSTVVRLSGMKKVGLSQFVGIVEVISAVAGQKV